ncbi:MAG TPA: ion transporter, partial [Lacipirellulaceae bacterium]|nr:ion transporter [Lacipirellulaceae bacterium]
MPVTVHVMGPEAAPPHDPGAFSDPAGMGVPPNGNYYGAVHPSPEYHMRERLKEIVEQHDTPAGRVFDLVIQALILTSLASFSIETLPRLSPTARSWLAILEVVTVAIFTIEYLLRLWLADRPLKFALSFYGLIDLIAVLPFYLSVAIDLRSIRAIRFLRLFRAFKMVRYSRAIQRFHRAFIIAREELVLFSLVALLVLYFAAVGIYYCESAAQPEQFASVFHSLWWSVATLITVGYGDVYPITVGGRVFTFLVL